MRPIIFFLFLLSTCWIYGQNHITGIEADKIVCKQKNNLEKYYENVYKAEDKIMQSNYKEATKAYQKAFTYRIPFRQDLTCAMEAERRAGSEVEVIQKYISFYWKIFGKQLDNEKFVSKMQQYFPWIDSFVTKQNFNKIMDTCKLTQAYNKELAEKLELLHETDQQIRFASDKSGDFARKVQNIDSANLAELLKLYKQYKIINEITVGPRGMNTVGIILTHNYDVSKKWFAFFQEQVCLGNFYNRSFVQIIDNYTKPESKETIYGNNQGMIIFDKFVTVVLNDSIAEKVNIRRKSIYLESYQDANQKCIWLWKNENPFLDDFTWSFYPQISIFAGDHFSPVNEDDASKNRDSLLNCYKQLNLKLVILEK